jgi:hypothetical protein
LCFHGYWAGHYAENTQKRIKEGVDLMMKTTLKLLGKERSHGFVPVVEDKEMVTKEKDDGDDQAKKTHEEL